MAEKYVVTQEAKKVVHTDWPSWWIGFITGACITGLAVGWWLVSVINGQLH